MTKAMKDLLINKIKELKENEWYNPIKFIIFVSLGTLGIVLIILGTPSRLGGEEWIGFWGSIAGSIIGGVITIIALMKTIVFEREKEEKNTRIQNQPYFICTLNTKENDKELYCYRTKGSNEIKDVKGVKFSIKNIGGNSAVDIRLHEIWVNANLYPEIYRCTEHDSELLVTPYLERNNEINYCIDICNLHDTFKNKDTIKVIFVFSDLFEYYYTQEIQFIIYDNKVSILDIKQPEPKGKIYEVSNN